MAEILRYIHESERAKYEADGWTVKPISKKSHHGHLGRCIATKEEGESK